VTRANDRAPEQIRPTTIQPGFVPTATGSCLISQGETRVICTATVATTCRAGCRAAARAG
jgi:ribonuclease PH